MSREVQARTQVTDQFAVWQDEVTKVADLEQADFAVVVTRDGAVVDDTAVTITEIPDADGEYRAAFTPPSTGYMQVEITYSAGGQVFIGEYDVVAPVVVGGTRPPGYGA